jgi:hypothetical protein
MALRLIIKRILYFLLYLLLKNKNKIYLDLLVGMEIFHHALYKDLFNLFVPGKKFSKFMTSTRLTRKQLNV